MAAAVIILLGPPGAGKGTQSEILARRYDAVHLSSGQIFRDSGDTAILERNRQGLLGKTEDFLRVVEAAIAAVPDSRMIILDSVGKMLPEANWLVGNLKQHRRSIKVVIYLKVDQAEAVNRNLKRGRADDDKAAQQVRWQLYRAETLPVLNFYRQAGLLVEVDGLGTVEAVAGRIEQVLA